MPSDGLDQILRALEGQLGVAVLRVELRDIRLVVINLGLKRRLFEEVKQVALFDLGAFDKGPLFEKRGDPGDQRHPADRLDAPDELVGLGDLLALGADHPDRRWPARHGLSFCRNRKRCEEKGQQETPKDLFVGHRDSSERHGMRPAPRVWASGAESTAKTTVT